MLCPNCGRALDAQLNCSVCASAAIHLASAPGGDAFLPAKPENILNKWKAPLLGVLATFFCALTLWLNYVRAIRWAGVMNAESFGYMIGGCLTSFLVAGLIIYLAQKLRRRKSAPDIKFFNISALAFLISLLSLGGSPNHPSAGIDARTKQELGNLIRQAAGKKEKAADAHWWDAPTRDFIQDIISKNQQYTAEVRSLDNSAIKDLYSTDSYAGKTHMEKIIAQLQAASAVDEKYSSLDPVLKKMKERVASVDAPEEDKANFLEGFDTSINQSLGPRNELIRVEKDWMDSSVQLYQFMLVNSDHYSIRDAKLYFDSTPRRKEFVERQSKAIALHKEFLALKAKFEENRTNNMNELGVSPSELSPSQFGKIQP